MLLRRIFLLFFMKYCLCDNQTVFTLNGKKSVHVVSDKFLSVSVDPAVLLSGLNISGTSLLLSSNLNPAYVRIAGPSTEFLEFIKGEEVSTHHQISDEPLSLTVTHSQWDSLNQWFMNANLVPIFGINEGGGGSNRKFDPKTIFLLLDTFAKINVSCLWQLGYDSSGKQVSQYLEEIKSLRNVLNAFPRKTETWRIVGGDLSNLQPQESPENLKEIFQTLAGVAHSVMWEKYLRRHLLLVSSLWVQVGFFSKQDEELFPKDDIMTKLLSAPTKPELSVWTTAPKNKRAVSFASGILWAKQIGDAANKGFGVVFRQPRLYEFFTDTPVYWISVLHKHLMGINVLDVNASDNQKVDDINVYAHCTRRQNNFSRRGAATIFVVNNASTEHTIALKILGATQLKTIEVQTYTLTSDGVDSADTYLNGQKLTPETLQAVFVPKIRRAKINKYLTFDVLPKSVDFFVLPDARVQVCINGEHETNLLIEEIHADQKINFPSDIPTKVSPRFGEEEEDLPPVTLVQLYNEMQKELEADEKFYNAVSKYVQNNWKLNDLVKTTPTDDEDNINTRESAENFESNTKHERTKTEITKRKSAFLRRLAENSKLFRKNVDQLGKEASVTLRHSHDKNLSGAKGKLNLASEELDDVILTATKIIKGESLAAPKHKRDCKGGGRGGHGRGRGSKGNSKQTPAIPKSTPRPKPKRAINMDLLRQKVAEEYTIGKSETPGTQAERIKSRESDFALEIKKQRDKIKADLERLLHPGQTHSLNSAEKINNEKSDFAADAKKQYAKMKLDLEKILHPEATKNEQKLQARVFDSEEDYFEDSNDFDSFDEGDINGYEKIDEEFKLGKPLDRNVNKELWNERFHGRDGNGPNVLFSREFVLDSKDPREVEETIKNLENYFNRAKSPRYEPDDDLSIEYDYDMDDINYQKPHPRFKRDDKHYTEADIRYYRQLMNHNIKHMRDSMRKQQLLKLKKTASPVQKIKSKNVMNGKAPRPLLHPNLSNSLKPRTNVDYVKPPGAYDLSYNNNNSIANLENKKTENSVKYLKNRLAQHKRIEDVQGGMRLRNFEGPEVNDETQRLVNLIKSELRKKRRRPRSALNAKVDSSSAFWDSSESKDEEENQSDEEDAGKNKREEDGREEKWRKIRRFRMIADPNVNEKVRVKRSIDVNGSNCIGDGFLDEEKNYKSIWSSKVAVGKDGDVDVEAPFCFINNTSVNANASIDFHAEPMESKSNFFDDIFRILSKLLYKLFTS